MHGLDENVLKAECFNFFMMGMPWFRQGNKYDIRLSVRVDVNTKSKINANDESYALAA